jgi:hypothetical protein
MVRIDVLEVFAKHELALDLTRRAHRNDKESFEFSVSIPATAFGDI